MPSNALGELARQRLARGGTFQFCARGLSMRPSIPDGALVTVAPLGPRGVRVGDVVLVFITERASVHRVVARWAGLVWTKGDLNPWSDPPVPAASVVGRVVVIEHERDTWRLDGPLGSLAAVAWAAIAWLPRRRRAPRRMDPPGFV